MEGGEGGEGVRVIPYRFSVIVCWSIWEGAYVVLGEHGGDDVIDRRGGPHLHTLVRLPQITRE